MPLQLGIPYKAIPFGVSGIHLEVSEIGLLYGGLRGSGKKTSTSTALPNIHIFMDICMYLLRR